MIIYMVTGGDYSDYHVEGLFSTREKAEQYIAEDKAATPAGSYGYGLLDIEEYVLDGAVNVVLHLRL